jgi:hypothetical protein
LASDFIPFVCSDCNRGTVELQPSADNYLVMRLNDGYVYEVFLPPTIILPRCNCCEAVFLGYAEASLIAKAMGGTLP